MSIIVRRYSAGDVASMTEIWNEVVVDGIAFPQTEPMSLTEAKAFFDSQSYNGVVEEEGTILGLYILHPNNVGRCGHIANASYAVRSDQRGKHLGETLVRDSVAVAAKLGFRIMQFNAVVATNLNARHLYKKIGFTELGVIPGGFRMNDGTYADIIPYYIALV